MTLAKPARGEIERLLVCPICQSPLPLDAIEREGRGACPKCARAYRFVEGVFDLVPDAPPESWPAGSWELWNQLQNNGAITYEASPELNLSIGARRDAQRFAEYCDHRGWVLDIGCGPQALPSYAAGFPGTLVGLDPLMGVQPRQFFFVRGLGEYLPFAPQTFDQVMFATSLDHLIDPVRALREAARVLKPSGVIHIWLDGDEESRLRIWYFRIAKLMRLALTPRAFLRNALGAYRVLFKDHLVRPEGAADQYHVNRIGIDELRPALAKARLRTKREVRVAGTADWFVTVTPG